MLPDDSNAKLRQPKKRRTPPTLKSNTDRSRPRTQIPPTRNETLLKEEPVKRTRDTAAERKKIYRHLCCGSSSLSFTGGVDGFPEIIGPLILRSYAKPLGVSTHELLLVQLTNLPYPNLLAQPCAPGQHTQTPTLCTVAPPPLTIHVTQTAPA